MGLPAGNSRPVISLPWKPYEIGIELIAMAGLLVCTGLAAWYWPSLPATIPQHIGPSGAVDAWNTKQYMTTFFILVILALYILLSVVSLFPRWYNYPVKITEENAGYIYRLGRNLMQWLKAGITWHLVLLEFQFFQIGMGRETFPTVLILLAQMLVFLGLITYYAIRMLQPPVTAIRA